MKSCPCQETGRDGTRQHGEIVASISDKAGDGFFVCLNHVRNYEESISRYGTGMFGSKKALKYLDENFDSVEMRTQTKWSF